MGTALQAERTAWQRRGRESVVQGCGGERRGLGLERCPPPPGRAETETEDAGPRPRSGSHPTGQEHWGFGKSDAYALQVNSSSAVGWARAQGFVLNIKAKTEMPCPPATTPETLVGRIHTGGGEPEQREGHGGNLVDVNCIPFPGGSDVYFSFVFKR